MSYQVLARKWRPRTFAQVVGQEHVLRALINALDEQRLHHAYLFTGTRGVGKTTLGRILAKSLNCEQGISSQPCGQCPTCREIDQGRFVDLIEVDAASRTKVEDTRELLDNVQYAPTRGRYKVYLIDEVHMLSGHSFNALLKTLEEPPEHVKFILATTDPQKLPVTVLSRCLRFNLKRITQEQIADHLAQILDQEGIEHQGRALELLARAADGSLRDALSLLDQAIAFGGGRVDESATRDMLGDLDPHSLRHLIEALADGDGPRLLSGITPLIDSGADLTQALEGLISLLHRIAVCQIVPQAGDDDPWIRGMAQRLAADEIQLYYQIALEARRDLPLAPDPRSGFEMALLRLLAFRPDAPNAQHNPPPTPPQKQREAPTAAAQSRETNTPASEPPPTPTAATPEDENGWRRTAEALPVNGMARQLALNAAWGGLEGDTLRLLIRPEHARLATPNQQQRLQQALQQHLGRPIRLRLDTVEATPAPTPAQERQAEEQQRIEAARRALQQDPGLRALKDTFQAELDENSIQPLENDH